MILSKSNIGAKFEEELSTEFGLRRVPGSGNQAHSKLDLYGYGFRWSLKATDNSSCSIKLKDVQEAIQAAYGLNGTGETPVWAFRIQDQDMIMMDKDTFKALCTGDIRPIGEEKGQERVNERRARAATPSLFRNGD